MTTKSNPKSAIPLEYVCLFLVEFSAQGETLYIFTAVNVFAKCAIHTGYEIDNSAKSLLKHLKLFMKHLDFVKNPTTPFAIVLHAYQEVKQQIDQIIRPFNGTVVFNKTYVAKVIVSFGESLYKDLPKP